MSAAGTAGPVAGPVVGPPAGPALSPADVPPALRAELLCESLPYIRRWAGTTVVVKFGGHAMADAGLAAKFAQDAVLLAQLGVRLVVVHGGGPQIGEMMTRLGKKPEFRDGLRVTDAETLDIAQMVLTGKVNSGIVRAINTHGSLAVGVGGADARLITARERDPELGFVGDVAGVDPSLLERLLGEGLIPVVSTIGSDATGQAYNINADTAAGAIAVALRAEKLVYLTDVAGLYGDLDDADSLVSRITAPELADVLAAGGAAGGMIPKAGACVHALANGVASAHLLDGRVAHVVLLELFTDAGIGTMIIADGTAAGAD